MVFPAWARVSLHNLVIPLRRVIEEALRQAKDITSLLVAERRATASLTASSRSLARRSAHRTQHPRDERQQFLQRGEMRGLPRDHMLDPSRHPSLRHVTIDAEVHDKGAVD